MALTPDGLVIKRYPEILDDVGDFQQEEISDEFVTTDDTAVGQQNQVISEMISRVWALVEAVNDNFNVDKAEGANLDDLGALKHVFRLSASTTQGYIYFTGDDESTIPSNSIFSDGTNRFFTQLEYAISRLSAVTVKLSVLSIQNETDYTVTINGTEYLYESDATADIAEILAGLKADIDADIDAHVTASISGTDLVIETVDGDTFSLAVSANLDVGKVTSVGYVIGERTGPIVVSTDTLNEIVTPILGLDSVTNRDDLIVGRNRETDEQFRIRIKADASVLGKATVPAIESALRNTPGVSYAAVIENITMITDGDGRPPKSFESIVQGGTDLEVATVIWETKAAGIETYGSVTQVIVDSDDQSQEIKFSRPEAIHIAVRVTYDFYEEEVFPSNGEVAIQNAVLNHINSLGIGTDVIPKRMYGPIYMAANGIENLVVEVQEIDTPGDTPVGVDWQETTIPVAARYFSQTSLNDIYIVGP